MAEVYTTELGSRELGPAHALAEITLEPLGSPFPGGSSGLHDHLSDSPGRLAM